MNGLRITRLGCWLPVLALLFALVNVRVSACPPEHDEGDHRHEAHEAVLEALHHFLLAADPHGHGHDHAFDHEDEDEMDDDDDEFDELEERLDHLEHRIDELIERLEVRERRSRRGVRGSDAPPSINLHQQRRGEEERRRMLMESLEQRHRKPRQQAQRHRGRGVAPQPPTPPVPPVPPMPPNPPMPPRADVHPEPPMGRALPMGEQMERTYRLPEGRLEALTKLMARQDVPVLIRPGDDGITVLGNAYQQAIFAGFVELLVDSDEEVVVEYELPEGKRAALYELMALPEVPVLISPRKDVIAVHGDAETQAVFRAFVDMIDAPASPVDRRARGGR